MGLVLNILLLVLSATATLAAFGGKTWREGSEPLRKRLTRRGWLSLICLALALQVGVGREVLSDRQSDTLRKERDDAKQLQRMADSKLNELRGELTNTRENLSNQSQINLITTLSTGHSIRDVIWEFRFNARAAQAANVIEYLTSNLPPDYRGVARVELSFYPPGGFGGHIELSFDRDVVVTTDPMAANTSLTTTLLLPRFLTNRGTDPLRERSSFLVVQQMGAAARPNAAVGFSDLAARGEIGSITLRMVRVFRTVEESRIFIVNNPHLRPQEPLDTYRGIEVAFALPDRIADSFSAYWRSAVTFSTVTLYLDDAASLTISRPVALKAIARFDPSSVTAEFQVTGAPEISIVPAHTRSIADMVAAARAGR